MSAFDHRQPAHTSGGDDCPTPSTPIDTFTYDDDGNLRLDDQYEYVWDAENRLIEIAPVSPSDGDIKLVFDYDYMSRRVRKRAVEWDETLNNNEGDWKATANTDLR